MCCSMYVGGRASERKRLRLLGGFRVVVPRDGAHGRRKSQLVMGYIWIRLTRCENNALPRSIPPSGPAVGARATGCFVVTKLLEIQLWRQVAEKESGPVPSLSFARVLYGWNGQ